MGAETGPGEVETGAGEVESGSVGIETGALRYVAWAEDDEPPDRTLEHLAHAGDTTDLLPPERAWRTILLTSGTSGPPKGASRGPPSISAAVAVLSVVPLRVRETVLPAVPLFHMWGFAHFALAQLLSSTLVLQRRFDPESALGAVDRHRVTCWPMVPIMLQRLLELPEETRRGHDCSTLRTVPVSGSALSGDLAVRFMDGFGDVVYNVYGSTEVAWATIATPYDLRVAPGTAGRPPYGTVVRICDVFPQEVEEALARHYGIAEAAVIGVDDERWGQRLEAFVVAAPHSGEGLDEQQVKEHVKANLARYKAPRAVVFVPELPRNPQGKVVKSRLQREG